jgi:hypothetical protein
MGEPERWSVNVHTQTARNLRTWVLASLLRRRTARPNASVPIQKFLSSAGMQVDGATAKALDACQDIIGGLGPS